MKRAIASVLAGIFFSGITLSLYSFGNAGRFAGEKPSFEQQVQVFKKLGFEFNPGADTSDLNRWGGHKRYEDQPYAVMYMELGSYTGKEPKTPLTNKCWHLDREQIRAKSGYSDLLRNLQRITGGEITFEAFKENLDPANGISRLSFTVKGKLFSWQLKIADGTFDSDLFANLTELTQQVKSIRQFTVFELNGENLVIGFENRDGLYAIRKATGLHISWMS